MTIGLAVLLQSNAISPSWASVRPGSRAAPQDPNTEPRSYRSENGNHQVSGTAVIMWRRSDQRPRRRKGMSILIFTQCHRVPSYFFHGGLLGRNITVYKSELASRSHRRSGLVRFSVARSGFLLMATGFPSARFRSSLSSPSEWLLGSADPPHVRGQVHTKLSEQGQPGGVLSPVLFASSCCPSRQLATLRSFGKSATRSRAVRRAGSIRYFARTKFAPTRPPAPVSMLPFAFHFPLIHRLPVLYAVRSR